MKSRLVARGDLQRGFGRTDSPTCDMEGVNLVCSFASSEGLVLRMADLDHGYFQGEPLSYPLMLRPPKGGLPDENVREGDRLLAKVPIYGTKDAGRGLWKKIRRVMSELGLKENFVYTALYTYAKDGRVQLMIATHVDDLLWACTPEAEHIITQLKSILQMGTEEENNSVSAERSLFKTMSSPCT